MDALLELAVTNAGFALVLAVMAFAADRYVRRPSVAHMLWAVVMMRLLMPPLVNLPLLPAAATIVPTVTESPEGAAPPPLSADAAAPPWWGGLRPSPSTAIAVAWGLGIALIGGLTLARMLRFHRGVRQSPPAEEALQRFVAEVAGRMDMDRVPRVWVVDAAVSPMVWAPWRRSSMVLPQGLLDELETEELETLIAHELAHLSRGDHRLRYLEQLAVAVFWWYPLAWIARRRLRRSEERCCDALVTAKLPDRSRAYAKCLLKTTEFLAASGVKDPAVASGAAGVEELKERLTMIIRKTHPRSLALAPRLALGLLVVAALAVVPVRATTPTVDPASVGARLVTVDYHETDVREVLRSILTQAGVPSMAFTPDVEGVVTVSLFEEPAEQALQMVLTEAGLQATDEHGMLWIHPEGRIPERVQSFTGEPITLTLNDADIKDVLRTFSSLTNLNIVVDPDVSGSVTVELREVPWDQALGIIVGSNGLQYEVEQDVVRVFRPAPRACDPVSFRGGLISLDLEESEIRDVLNTFYQVTGLEYEVAPEVEAKVTVKLVEVPWDQALDVILRSNGLAYRVDGDVMRVFPAETR